MKDEEDNPDLFVFYLPNLVYSFLCGNTNIYDLGSYRRHSRGYSKEEMKKITKQTPELVALLFIIVLIPILSFAVGRITAPKLPLCRSPEAECPPPVVKTIEEIAWINEQEIIRRINAVRKREGLVALTRSPLLEGSAQLKAEDMAEKEYFKHDRPNGDKTFIFFDKIGYKYRWAGENLAHQFETARAVVEAWLISPTHKEIILMPEYEEIGIGQAVLEGEMVIVAHFGKQ